MCLTQKIVALTLALVCDEFNSWAAVSDTGSMTPPIATSTPFSPAGIQASSAFARAGTEGGSVSFAHVSSLITDILTDIRLFAKVFAD